MILEKCKTKNDIIFLYTGSPLPAMLDLIAHAKQTGLNPLLVLLDRGENELILDSSLINYDIIRIDVGYKKVELNRFLTLPKLLLNIRRIILSNLTPGGIILTCAYDMLLFAQLINLFHSFKIRHQVRDLNALQLNNGIVPEFFKQIERVLLLGVEKVIISSPKFATDYYENIYKGEIILLENVPQKSVWTDFKRQPRNNGELVIGYIGILRYKESLFNLIETVERLVKEGQNIKVVFAGGGKCSDLKEIQGRISNQCVFEFSGPYEYAKDIKQLYQDVDLIYAVYDENMRNCQIAMPNKFYESILSKIPLLVAANTFVGEQTLKYNIGEVVSLKEKDSLYNLLKSISQHDSWYKNALDTLQDLSAESLYNEFNKAMAKSVAH